MKTMTRPQGTAHAEHELAQLAIRFQDWRHRRTTPSDPIPQSLWEQAVALTTVFSVSRVAHAKPPRLLRRGGFACARLLAKKQDPEPLQAERRLLQSKQQPKIPLQHQVQHTPIGRGQRIPGEPCAQGLAVRTTQVHLFWARHRRLHPYEQHHGSCIRGSTGVSGVADSVGDVKHGCRTDTEP
jgi:hypothetical protein